MTIVRSLFEEMIHRRREVRSVIAVTFLLATVLALTASGTPYLRNVMAGRPEAAAEFWDDFLWMSIWLYAWLLIVPVVYVLALHVTNQGFSGTKVIAAFLAGFAFAYVVHVSIQVAAMFLPPFEDVHPTMTDAVLHHMLSGVYLIAITYGGVAATCHAFAVRRHSQEVEMKRVRLESELVQARMRALRSQLHPHFLFNALNSVSTLMYRDVRAADEMLAGIGDLLRILIKDSDRNLITLGEEMEFVSMYLRIEKVRHGDALQVLLEIPPELEQALVPALVLQPVVENAIKHGTSLRAHNGEIAVSIAADGGKLHLTVSDNGPGFPSGDAAAAGGVGIANLRARLMQMYGDEQELTVRSSPEGAVVDIMIPLRLDAVETNARAS